MDVKIKEKGLRFKLRVSGLLIVDDKLLTVDIANNGFLCCPGGHVHLGEDSETAMNREFSEEVKYNCEVGKCLANIESFFGDENGTVYHEVCYYYLMKPKENVKAEDYVYVENDEGELKELKFKWIKLEDLPKVDFRPRVLGEKLAKRDFEFSHLICKD